MPRTCAISAPGSIPRSTQARLQHLRLTPAGSAAVERAIPALQRGEAEALAALSNAERATLAELLHKAARSRRS